MPLAQTWLLKRFCATPPGLYPAEVGGGTKRGKDLLGVAEGGQCLAAVASGYEFCCGRFQRLRAQ